MARKYNLKLTGYVGGYSFDPTFVDYRIDQLKENPVLVKINSLGGDVGAALTICESFKNHGNVTVHFVGLNASAATIAALGAKHSSIEASAMYLVHKVSTTVFEWASLNADQLADKIAEYTATKDNLDKFDMNIAAMYAKKCKKPIEDLLALMKVGGWLTAKEALDWGFVDDIDSSDSTSVAPQMTASIANELSNNGIPLPNIPIAEDNSPFSQFMGILSKMFRPQNDISHSTNTIMNKVFNLVCALLTIKDFAFTEGNTSITDTQLQSIEDCLAQKNDKIATLEAALIEKENIIATLSKNPADDTSNVVDDKNPKVEPSPVDDFYNTCNNAQDLHNMIH